MEQRPSRRRRAIFIFVVTALAGVAAFYLAVSGLDTKTAQIATDGFISVVLWTVVAYIAGHSVDRTQALEYVMRGRNDRSMWRGGLEERSWREVSREATVVKPPAEAPPAPPWPPKRT